MNLGVPKFFSPLGRVLPCGSGWPGTGFVVEAGLNLIVILLPPTPECWDYRYATMAYFSSYCNGKFALT